MSRVGNNPVAIADGVSVEILADKLVVKGKLGELEQPYDGVTFEQSEGIITVKRNSESKDHKSKHGLYRA
jgi:large subunit ribosomal protein L6